MGNETSSSYNASTSSSLLHECTIDEGPILRCESGGWALHHAQYDSNAALEDQQRTSTKMGGPGQQDVHFSVFVGRDKKGKTDSTVVPLLAKVTI